MLRYAIIASGLTLTALLQGCASTPQPASAPLGSVALPQPGSLATSLPSLPESETISVGSEIAIRAISLLGAPYKYGGSGPAGFDCSGLVQFVYDEVGIEVPRTAAEQFRTAEPVKVDDLAPGDLLFFKIHGKRVSHVGIYTGSGRFIHAPQTGRPIELRSLDDNYYRPRLAGAGRF